MPGSSHRLLSRPARTAIALGLALLGCVMLWVALAGPARPEAAPAGPSSGQSGPPLAPGSSDPTGGRSSRAADQDVRDRTKGLILPESEPVEVSVPRLGVHPRLVDLGLEPDGAMEVPKNPAEAGWFSRGATPGALGPAVIAGHVTWDGAPAVFHRLGSMRRGDQVLVARKDGTTAVFTVSRVARFSKSQFPSHAVYGAIDHAGLRLITCGGTYDNARKSYLDNVIVFARLTAVRGPGS